ncbi:MAG: cupin domain-containing protein, partial [Bacillota bacterium]
IERIISCGQISPPGFWYDQDEDEWVLLVQGSARLSLSDGSNICLRAGQHILIPAHQKHRIEYTSSEPPCIWICVFGNLR